MILKFKEYIRFMQNKHILSSAIGLTIGGVITDLISRINHDFLIPMSRGKFKVIKKHFLKKILVILYSIINMIFVTYLFFRLNLVLEKHNL